MSVKAKEFYRWLLIESHMDSKIARKKYSLIKILENFAIRKSYGFGNLLDASPETIAQYIETIRTNMSLKTEDDKRNGELTGVLTLLKKFLENSEKEQQNAKEIALLQPTISGIAPDTMPHNLKDASIPPQQNLEQTPLEKLRRRIAREFEKCTYIGDISISDEEYGLLMPLLQTDYQTICQNHNHIIIDPLFAVGLVQIGIRYYDGRFWSHVQKELKLEKLPMNHQGWIGKSFYKTLIRFGKFHVAENEFMNNILLHCFITKHYANDLFDFLFAYYQIDLERDLSRNSAEMRKYLMQTMSKGEASARAYKIKKHTADAVSANERGCKIRVGRILRFMDNALFNDLYPENSQNRIAQLFCEWAKSSGRFEYARRATAGLTRKGEKRFSTPFIHFDTKREKFYLVLPQQYIHLNAEDDIPQMYWKIRIENFENILEVSSDSCVTGCKTEKIDCFEVPADRLLQEIEIELLKDSGDRVKRFLLKSASIRFFDNDWDMIDSVTYTKYLPEGQAYAFTDPDGVLQTDSDAIDGFEKSLGYGLYTLTLQKGDVLRLPDGKAKSVGKPLEEGLLQQKLVHGAYVMRDEKISIYSTTPSVYFRMKPNQENGTLIIINGERFRFDAEKCVRFDLDEKTDEKGYILKLSEYIVQDGIY